MKNQLNIVIGKVFIVLVANKMNKQHQNRLETTEVQSGGQENVEDETSVPNIVQKQQLFASKDHTTLVAAVKAAGLVTSLSNAGPFTVLLQQMLHLKKNCLQEQLKVY